MTYQEFQAEYKRERVFLSAAFLLMLLFVGGAYAIQHAQEVLFIATQAAEYPKEIISSVIRGIAHR